MNWSGIVVLIYVLFNIQHCTKNPEPEYTVDITVRDYAYNTVFVGETIRVGILSYLNLSPELLFGPVPYYPDDPVTWSSSNSAIATVTKRTDTSAVIYGKTSGKVTITAECGESLSSVQFRVFRKTEQILTSGDGTRDYPCWSADGTQIAYSKDGQIYLIDAVSSTGYTEIPLTPTIYYASYPCWSPDGARICFSGTTDRTSGATYLYIVDVASGSLTKLTSLSGNHHPGWSPDGSTIAFSHSAAVCTIPAVGGSEVTLTSSKGSLGYLINPQWSSDGLRIAYSYEDAVYIVDIASQNEQKIIENGSGEYGDRENAQWSDDGTSIVYKHDSRYIKHIPTTGGAEYTTVYSSTLINIPTVSTANGYIVFSDYYGDLLAVNIDGSDLFRVNNGVTDIFDASQAYNHPEWSPDGSKIVFVRYTNSLTSQIGIIGCTP